MVVGMRAPGQVELLADLRDPDRPLHGPEMRIGKRDIDAVQLQGVAELAPIGGDHVGRSRQAGGLAEFGHDLPPGESFFGAARVFGVGEDVMQVLAQCDSLFQRPGAVGVKRDAGVGEAFLQCRDGLDLFRTFEDAPLEFEVLEAVALLCGFRECDDRRRRECLLVPQPVPGDVRLLVAQVLEIGFLAVADVKQITEHLHRVALLAVAPEQRSYRKFEVLAQEVQKRRLDRGDHVDGGAQVERLQAATGGVAVSEGGADLVEDTAVVRDARPRHDRCAVLQRVADLLPARHFANTDVSLSVFEYQDVSREIGRVGATEVQFHGVVTGHRIHGALGNPRRSHDFLSLSGRDVAVMGIPFVRRPFRPRSWPGFRRTGPNRCGHHRRARRFRGR